jgi:DNA-binding PadR family transcriptional regulator
MGGPGGWFGGPPWGGPGGRRPRPRRGDVRAAILTLLAEQPMHGYQVITELAERSGGVWRPSPGSVYPTLQQLEDEQLVRGEESDGRRVFHLTEAGQTVATELAAGGQRAPWETMADDADAGVVQLRHSAMQVARAAMQVASAGSDAQIGKAEELLSQVRRDLYRLLAEDDDSTG